MFNNSKGAIEEENFNDQLEVLKAAIAEAEDFLAEQRSEELGE